MSCGACHAAAPLPGFSLVARLRVRVEAQLNAAEGRLALERSQALLVARGRRVAGIRVLHGDDL